MSDKELQIENGVHSELRFIFLGMAAVFSYHVLERLLRAGMKPAAVWMPAGSSSDRGLVQLRPQTVQSPLPVIDPFMEKSILQLAWEHNIDVFAAGDLAANKTADALAQTQASVGIIACFPLIIPPSLLTILRVGFLNLHPSLLPKYRGPDPLFWQFRTGARSTGVTLHHVDSAIDSGDIVLQQPVTFSDGLSQHEANVLCAEIGAGLVISALTKLKYNDLPRTPQSGEATYFGQPGTEDFNIPVEWTARRAFNFIRGTDGRRMPYNIRGQDFVLQARSAVAYSDQLCERPMVKKENEAWINFRRGSLRVLTW
jgi:methionyl-tRNA formyltransferase